MKIRQLTREERFEAARISRVAFHGRVDDPEAGRADIENDERENWGAFDDDGTLAAHIVNNRYLTRIDGNIVPNGGIGGVSTLPEYRESGAVRKIFGELLPSACRAGEVISTLYPFKHSFYRKFGYETVCLGCEYEFSPAVLRDYRFDGEVRQMRPGESVAPYTELYNRFAAPLNLSAVRDDEAQSRHFSGTEHKDREFTYLFSRGGRRIAYLCFRDVQENGRATINVRDYAWDGREGFLALLGFLSRFTADYGNIRISLPAGTDLVAVLHSPDVYGVKRVPRVAYMLRAVNAERLLSVMARPAGARLALKVRDELIPENEGTWLVTDAGVSRTGAAPDAEVDIRALGLLAVGAISPAEATLREDVEVLRNEAAFHGLFRRKPLYMNEHF